MKLFVPLLDNGNGSVMASFMMDFYAAFKGREVELIRASDSHANRGMNKIANAFLDSECDIWINIDADIRFRPSDVDDILSHDLPLVYGIYPKKEEAAQPCLCTFPEVDVADAHSGLAEVRRCGRGFMLVRREVLEAMKEDNGGPALRFHNHGRRPNGREHEWDFFPSGCVTGAMSALEVGAIDPNRQGGCGEPPLPARDADGFPIREWISEDWYFCERARALGFKTMVDTRIALGHVGQKEFRFGGDQVTRMDSNISSWRDIHGWFDYADLYRELAIKMGKSSADYADFTNPNSPAEIGGDKGRRKSADKPVFVEVGCWMGKSIAFMAEELRKLKKEVALHVVDTFCGEPSSQEQANLLEAHSGSVEKIFRSNMEALGITVNVHAMSSLDASQGFFDETVDAVFIDGDHSEGAVRDDILAWLPRIKPGGWLTGHDIDEPGVAAAVKGTFADFEVRGRCWVVRKT